MNKVEYSYCCKMFLDAGYELLPVGQDTIAALIAAEAEPDHKLVELDKNAKTVRVATNAPSR